MGSVLVAGYPPWILSLAFDSNKLIGHRGTGYIGSFTVLALLEAGYKVVVIDNLYNSSTVALDRIELICGVRPAFYKVEITDEAAIDKVFDDHPDIDSVIHFAALKVLRILTAQHSD